MPDRSGLPSAARGRGAERFGLPSAVRGIPGVGKPCHCRNIATTKTVLYIIHLLGLRVCEIVHSGKTSFSLQPRSRWHGLHISTCLTRAKRFAVVELTRNLSQVLQEICGTPRQLTQLSIAVLAIPGVGFRFIDAPDSLHHQSYGVGQPLWRMRSICRQQEDVSFPDRLASPLAFIVDKLQHHVAFKLVEKLIGRINVEVPSRVGATDDHDDELRVFPDHPSPYWRLQ